MPTRWCRRLRRGSQRVLRDLLWWPTSLRRATCCSNSAYRNRLFGRFGAHTCPGSCPTSKPFVPTMHPVAQDHWTHDEPLIEAAGLDAGCPQDNKLLLHSEPARLFPVASSNSFTHRVGAS